MLTSIAPLIEDVFGKEMHLSITVAAEHYTAMMAENALAGQVLEYMHPAMKSLVAWHASEELEHKHVAFDVLKIVNDDYLLRIAGMLMVTIFLFGMASINLFTLMLQEKGLNLFQTFSELSALVFGTSEIRASGRPSFVMNNIRSFFDYFRPNFHPNDHDNRGLAEAYFAENKLVG